MDIKKLKYDRELQRLNNQREKYKELKTSAVKEQRFEKACNYRDLEKCVLGEINDLKKSNQHN